MMNVASAMTDDTRPATKNENPERLSIVTVPMVFIYGRKRIRKQPMSNGRALRTRKIALYTPGSIADTRRLLPCIRMQQQPFYLRKKGKGSSQLPFPIPFPIGGGNEKK